CQGYLAQVQKRRRISRVCLGGCIESFFRVVDLSRLVLSQTAIINELRIGRRTLARRHCNQQRQRPVEFFRQGIALRESINGMRVFLISTSLEIQSLL